MRASILFILGILFGFNLVQAQPCAGGSGSLPMPSKCFEIVSILVDACDGSNEGQNEMVRMKIGPNPLLLTGFSIPAFGGAGFVNWGTGASNPWRGLANFNATTTNKINTLNASITAAGNCGVLIPLNPNQSVPAGAELLLITSTSFNPAAQSFANLQDTLYVILQVSGNTAGHFANQSASAPNNRTLIINHTSCSDTVSYDKSKLIKQDQTIGAEDGATVNFSYSGTATYANYGCAVPIIPVTLEAGTLNPTYCPGATINLNGSVTGANCFAWQVLNPAHGSFSDSLILNPLFTLASNATGLVQLVLKVKVSCKTYRDTISFTVNPGGGSIYAGPDSSFCNKLSFKPLSVQSGTGTLAWQSTGLGTFDNNTLLRPTYTPNASESGVQWLIVSFTGSCGTLKDSVKIILSNAPNPAFTLGSLTVCQNSNPITLIPAQTGGTFSGIGISGNQVSRANAGNVQIKYLISTEGCADSSFQTLTINALPNAGFTPSQTLLCKDKGFISLNPTTPGGTFINLNSFAISNNQFPKDSVGTFTLRYIVSQSGCTDSSDQTITIEPKPNALISPSNFIICEGSPPITLTPVNSGGTFYGQGISGNQFFPNTTGLNAIMYVLTQGNCTDTGYAAIMVNPKPDASFSVSDTLVCAYSLPVSLTPTISGGIFLGNGVANNQFNYPVEGTWPVEYEVSNANCTDSSIRYIRVIEPPVADFSYTPQQVLAGKPVQFNYTGSGASKFLWRFEPNPASSSNLDYPIYVFGKPGQYTVSLIVFKEICSDTAFQNLVVGGNDTLQVPNVFTPNGDSINDRFEIILENISSYQIQIFNRWGELLFTSQEVNVHWDGKYKQRECPDGVYFYIIEARSNSGREYNLSGTVTLLR